MNKIKIKRKIRAFLNSAKDLLVSPKKKFNTIYKTNHWGDSESISGPGSRIDATANLRNEIEPLLKKFEIKIIIDAPCGDFNWMKLVDLNNLEYHGMDIVEDLIAENNKKYARSNIRFILKNIIDEKLPYADLILCRDLLAHLSNNNIYKVVNNFIGSGSKYLLTTSYEQQIENSDIITGSWRKMNLLLPPFNFPEPIYKIEEKPPEYLENGRNFDKSLLMWDLRELSKKINF